LCLANGGGIARDGRHKPSALVVTAQEPLLLRHAALVLRFGEKQHVAVLRIGIQRKHVGHSVVVELKIEVFAVTILKDIYAQITTVNHTGLDAGADAFKLSFQDILVHNILRLLLGYPRGIEPAAATFTGSHAKPLHHGHHHSVVPAGFEPAIF